MKVTLLRDMYLLADGKTVEALAGEADIDDKQAESLIKRGLAVKVESQEDSDKLSASDIVKVIKSADTIEAIKAYSEDGRKSVKEAFEAKLAELTES